MVLSDLYADMNITRGLFLIAGAHSWTNHIFQSIVAPKCLIANLFALVDG